MAERLTGFALQYYGEHDHAAGWTDSGWKIGYPFDPNGAMFEMFACPAERAEQTMREIDAVIGHRENELTGFTLFYNPGKGWQMSTRRKSEPGWSVQFIPDEQAQAILSMLEASGHPDGPLTIVPQPASNDDPAAMVNSTKCREWPECGCNYEAQQYCWDATNDNPAARLTEALRSAGEARSELTTAIRARAAL